MMQIPRKQAQIIAGAVFFIFFVVAFFYSLSKTRVEIEEKYRQDVQKNYDQTVKQKLKGEFRKMGYTEGYQKAEPDAELVAKKQKVEKDLLALKEKAIQEMQGYDREKICQIAFQSGVARGESDARKNWSVEYWDENTGVDIGKLVSFGKKVVRMQLKYRNFPVGAPLEVDAEKDMKVSNAAVCSLLQGLQWANPATYQFFEGIKDEVCGSGKLKRSEVVSKDKANEKFWETLPEKK